jgi:hypothetical protein
VLAALTVGRRPMAIQETEPGGQFCRSFAARQASEAGMSLVGIGPWEYIGQNV